MEEYVSLAPYTTFGIGGSTRYFTRVSDEKGLISALNFARAQNIPHCILAGGSNVVFSDGLFEGLVIKIESNSIEREGTALICAAGTPLSDVVSYANTAGLSGMETLAGIPGSLGGAVVGNAGAYGRSIGTSVLSVRSYDNGSLNTLSNGDCAFSYRESVFKHRRGVLISVTLSLTPGDSLALSSESARIIALREKKYPPGLRCPGSFFKNVLFDSLSPQIQEKIDATKIIEGKVPAGYLLEAVGARGMRYGDLSIAPYHGNLIVNEGSATAADVRALSTELKQRVHEHFGITLEEEVRYLP